MPVIEVQEQRPIPPVGRHILTLMDVELKEMDNFDKTAKTNRLIWQFQTKKIAPDNNPYELNIFTGTVYGPPKAKLTWLLDMMVPGITVEQAKKLDTDDLIGFKFECQIKHTPSSTDATKLYAEPLYLKGLQPSPFAKEGGEAEAEAEDFNDPFEAQ